MKKTIQLLVVALQLSASAMFGGGLALAAPIDWTCINGKKAVGALTTNTIPENNAKCDKYDFPSQEKSFTRKNIPDGCSAGGAPWQDRFKDSCDDHDRCYTTAGVSKKSCDDLFLTRMQFQCDYYATFKGYLNSDCKIAADRFHTGVKGPNAAAGAFSRDQLMAEGFCGSDNLCILAIAKNRDCMWNNQNDGTDNRGHACYTDKGERGSCGQAGASGIGKCIATTDSCDANCIAAKNRVCNTSNKGYQCYDNGKSGWCGIDSNNTPRCVQMSGGCDANCQAAISRKCTRDNQGYACYQGHTKGTCTYSLSTANCKI